MTVAVASTLTVENHLPADFTARALRQDVVTGLSAPAKWLPPRWFYDDRGSELFDEITRLPEYYPTRAERSILRARAAEIATVSAATTLVELGAGSAEKTRLLVDALRATGSLGTYVPVDVSDAALRTAAAGLLWEYPGLAVHAVVADFEHHLDRLPATGHRSVVLLGGTIGNLVPADRARFLRDVRAALRPGETLLLGTDLVKSPDVLVPAYDDAAGVTADFNRNVLRVLNRELGADFEPEEFDHAAVWDAEHEWIEMRLRARHAMRVRIPAVDLTVEFARGEEVRTEISAKFRQDGVAAELAAAGFEPTRWWTDEDHRFGLSLATAR
ncbi:L-histidine N(alpha)-methyltransferase [Cryptosporangium aurantiacum]|uniref:Histidine N-alpha-methyltransferase n=1 Tax=Cryptosporangium aurantiacum TaxID=134849 RepID=A0A1M7QE62_9ACTN|nr:L-histidine N(alpha)-methyltransferase [Cryptosporangium aurantiacum]SHN29186.1 L-histidine Nalpha-methyltransferase [Cryptosporangium aurantiacum]